MSVPNLFDQQVRKKNPSSPLMAAKLDELILKCGGLPEVIVVIAGVLAKWILPISDSCTHWICWICIAMDHVVDHILLWIMYWPSGFYQSQIHAHTGFVGFILLW